MRRSRDTSVTVAINVQSRHKTRSTAACELKLGQFQRPDVIPAPLEQLRGDARAGAGDHLLADLNDVQGKRERLLARDETQFANRGVPCQSVDGARGEGLLARQHQPVGHHRERGVEVVQPGIDQLKRQDGSADELAEDRCRAGA